MSISNKQEALDRLSAIEREQTELRKAIEKFDQKSVFDLKTFELICLAAGTTERKFESNYRNLSTYARAFEKLVLIAKVLNEGRTPNWNDNREKKHYCWFSVSSGFAFALTYYYYDHATMNTGSRLCFKSGELAEFAGKTFTDIYKAYLM